MQHTQLNVVLLLAVLLAAPAFAGTIARPTPRDPLLDGGDTVPCAAGGDYAAGTDATGRPVVPADVGAPPVPVPEGIAVPLKQGRGARRGRGLPAQPESAYVSLDGRRIAPLVNPRPCH